MKEIAEFTPNQTATVIFLTISITNGVGAFIMGLCLNSFSLKNRIKLLAFDGFGLVSCMIGLLYVRSIFGAWIFAFCYGVFVGFRRSLMLTMYAELFGVENLGKI